VEAVAQLIRARTKDSNGLEVGTFDGDTRPTAEQVESLIDASIALVATRLPSVVPDPLLPSVAAVIALDTACRVEKSYFPEQVQSDRSAYPQLRQEFTEALDWLVNWLEAGGTEGFGREEVGMIPVGSWTSIPGSWIGY